MKVIVSNTGTIKAIYQINIKSEISGKLSVYPIKEEI
jgi:hypothetical protein